MKSGNRGNKETREAETMEERNCGSGDLETRTSARISISEGQDSANRDKERQDIIRSECRNGQRVRVRIVTVETRSEGQMVEAETRSEGQDGGS